jgi:ribonuclease HI
LIEVYIDGLTQPYNPGGVATYGFIIYENNIKIFEESKVIGKGPWASNNLAEYSALINALNFLLKENKQNEEIIIKSDSKLLVNQMNGKWKCHGGLYVKKYYEAKEILKNFKNIKFVWIPRELNKEADELSRRAYKKYCQNI